MSGSFAVGEVAFDSTLIGAAADCLTLAAAAGSFSRACTTYHGRRRESMRTCLICKRCYDDEVAYCETDGAQTAAIMPGGRLLDGKYEIERLLGQGGMGAVFEAVQRGIERKVAVKLINPSFVSNAQALERFRREALAS